MVRIQAVNASNRAVALQTICEPGLPPYLRIFADVIDSSGKVLYPPTLGGEQLRSCPPPSPFSLAAGGTVSRRQYVILRSSHLQAVVHLAKGGGASTAVIARLSVQLGRRDSPRVTLNTTSDLAARVVPVAPGQLVYKQWVRCTSQSGQTVSVEGSGWVRTSRTRIVPLCFQPGQWQLAVGQLDHSVAEIEYTAPARHLNAVGTK